MQKPYPPVFINFFDPSLPTASCNSHIFQSQFLLLTFLSISSSSFLPSFLHSFFHFSVFIPSTFPFFVHFIVTSPLPLFLPLSFFSSRLVASHLLQLPDLGHLRHSARAEQRSSYLGNKRALLSASLQERVELSRFTPSTDNSCCP